MKKISKEQPKFFEFSKENLIKAENEIKKYPKNKKESAVIALLYLVQNQNNNWIPLSAIEHVAKILNMPYIKVYEVATFYSMFNLAPVGKYFIQVCTTTPCMIRGAKKITEVCKKNISINENELSNNKICSWTEVECLGACINAPMMQVNEDYYEDLDETNTTKILNSFLEDKPLKPGSYRNRKNSAPEKNQILINGNKNA